MQWSPLLCHISVENGMKVFLITCTMHFYMVNEIPTNAFNNYILLYSHAPTCFGGLKRHLQGARSDPDETVNR
jgi:hypothetical protein